MRFLANFGTALAGALVAVLLAMLISHLLGQQFHPWVAASIAIGCSLGVELKGQWQLSPGGRALLVGALAGLGYVVGTFLSAHA
ncbi:MAG TPA: hypothetical protein VFR91_09095 [Dyella sp.]|nr:hypothetical protein [Dyella sp.]